MAGLTVSSGMEHLSVVYIRDHRLGLYWGRELWGWVSVSEPISLSVVVVLVTNPSAKESAAARKGLAR